MKAARSLALATMLAVSLARPGRAEEFSIARIYIEYNQSANDLGFHVSLDAEDWTELKILDPTGKRIFDVTAKGGYKNLGMTELFFEGAEPNLDEFPLADLLALFPEGGYTLMGRTVDGAALLSTAVLTHDVPDGPSVSTALSEACDGSTIEINWSAVADPAPILPDGDIAIVSYQVLVGSFQVTVPASTTSLTVPEAYFGSLPSGTHPFEVLAIDVSGNQTITEGSFVKP